MSSRTIDSPFSSIRRGGALVFAVMLFLLLLAAGKSARAAAYTWNGSVSSDWFNPTNWTPQGTPGPSDTASISSGSPKVVAATNVGTLNLSGSATLNPTAVLTVLTAFNWTGGSVTGSLTVGASATFDLNAPGANLSIQGATIVNNGTAVWNGGTLYGNQTTIVTNNGTWLAQTDDQFYNPYGGSPSFYNNATFTKSPATQTTAFNGIAFVNSGEVNVGSGTLNLADGGNFGGTFVASNGTTLNLSGGGFLNGSITALGTANISLSGGVFTYGPNLTFNGIATMTGGSITLVSNTIPNLQLAGGNVTLAANFQNGSITNLTVVGAEIVGTNTVTGILDFGGTIDGALTVAAGSSCFMTNLTLHGLLTVAHSATLDFVSTSQKTITGSTILNNGTMAWDGGTIFCDNNTLITNNGTWLAETDDSIYNPYGGNAAFYNNGTFTKSPTTGTTTIGLLFDNTGTVNAETGTINLNDGGSLGGNFVVSTGAALNFSGGGYLDGAYTAAAGATVNLSGGPFTYGPAVDFSGGGASSFTGGSLTLTNTTITNLAINGGTISLSPTFQKGSITNLILYSGTLAGTNTVTGVLNFSGAINGVLKVAPGASCYITNLSLQGLLTVEPSATLNFVTTGQKTITGSTILNNGTVAWDGGTIFCNNNSLITNNGAWLAETDDSIYNPYGGAPTFYNNGSFTKSPTTGTTAISGLVFDSTGTVTALTGTINFNDGGYFDGSFSAAAGAQILLTGGAFSYGSAASFAGPGLNEITGGSLELINNPLPNLLLAGGTLTLAPGFQGGSITNLTLVGSTLAGTNTLTGVMHWQGGTISGVFNVASTGTLYLDGVANVYQYAALTNSGHIVWNGSGNWGLYNDTGLDGSINNLASAIIDIECNQSLYPPNGNQAGWLNNLGLLRKSLSASGTSVTVTFTNAGTVELLTGSLTFGSGQFGGQFQVANGTGLYLDNGGVLAGSFTAGEQAVVDLTAGTFTQTAQLGFAGLGSYLMTGSATLTLLANTIPNLQMEGGTILTAPGFQGGSITNLTLNGVSIGNSNLVTGSLTVIGNITAPLVVASNATLTWYGNVNGQITAKPGATLVWQGGNLTTPLFIPTNAVLNVDAIRATAYVSAPATNAGTLNWTAGTFTICCNNQMYNEGIFNIECDQSFQNYYNGEFVVNSGLIRKEATLASTTTGTTTWGVFLYNIGEVDVEQGALNIQNYATNSATGVYQCESNAAIYFNGGAIISGTYNAAAGGDIFLAGGTFTMLPPYFLNGAGSYQVTGGTITLLTNLIPNLQLVGGTILTGTAFQGGSVTNLTLNGLATGNSNYVTGQLTVYGTINGPVTVASNATFTWSGNVNAQITAEPGSTLIWQGGNLGTPLYIPTNVVLNVDAIYNTAQIAATLTNAGTLNWTGGTFRICCNNQMYNQGLFNIECDQSFQNYYNGEFVVNSGLIRKLATLGSTTAATTTWGVFLYNFGEVDVQQGALNIQNYATNSATGVYQCESNAAIYFNGGGIISGIYDAAAGGDIFLAGGTFTMLPPYFLNGAGSYQVTGATVTLLTNLIPNLQLVSGTILTGTGFQGGSVTNLTLNGLNLGNSNYVTGQLTVYGTINAPVTVASNATFTWYGTVNAQITAEPGATLVWQGGNLSTPLYIPTNAVLNVDAIYSTAQPGASLTNAGTLNWTAGTFRICCNNQMYNQGVFNIESDQTLQNYYNGEVFNNSGLLRKWMTTGGTTIQVIVDNTGTIEAESGQINFNNTFNQTGGTWGIGIDGAGQNGQINFSGAAPLPATFDVVLNNDYVLALSNSFTLLNYGSFTGVIGATNLPADGAAWNLTAGATALTLAVTNLRAPQNVTITSPANNQPFTLPVNIPITATATDPFAAISAIQFFAGTNLIGQATSSPYTFTWNSVPPGAYVLSALAVDAAGGMATSAPVSITVYYNHAQTTNYTWTGAVSSDWFTAGNWNPNNVPGVLDNVTLANGGTINLDNNASINNFTLSSGTIGGTGTLKVTNSTVWSGGSVTCPLTIATNAALAINGNVNMSGSILVNNGTVTWSSGYIQGSSSSAITNNGLWLAESGNQIASGLGTFVNNGIFRQPAGGTISLNCQSFVNNGTVDAEVGTVQFNDGGTLMGTYNAAPGTLIAFNGGTFTLGVLPNLTGAGTIEFTGGTLNIANNPAPALQMVGGTVVLGPVFQKAGAITNLTLAGSTLQGTNTIAGVMNWTAGSINGKLTVSPGAVLNASGGTTYLYSSTLINSGKVVWTGGSDFDGDGNSVVTNNGTWLAECNARIAFNNGNAIFVNNGLFQKTNSTGTTSFLNLAFVNNGTVDAESGAINFDCGGTPAGTYNATAGASVNFDGGTFALGTSPVFTGPGSFGLTGGTMNFATQVPADLQLKGGNAVLGAGFQNGGKISNLTNSGSTLSGNYTVTGTLTWLAGGIGGSITVAANATLNVASSGMNLNGGILTNNGTVNWTGGSINGSGLIINAGLFLASANGAFSSVTFTNNGTFRNLGGTTYCYGSPFVNNGLVDVEGGALSFNSGGTLGGTYNVAGYCTLLFASGNFTASAPPVVSGLGTSQFTGGTLTLLADQISGLALIGGNVALGPAFQNAGAITNLTISGSYLLGSNVVTGTLNLAGGGPNAGWLAVAPNGLLNLNSTSQINLPGSVLVNNGTVAWSGGIIQGNSGTLITNNNLWLVQTDNAVNNGYGGTPTFVNNGTFTKTATYGATTFSAVSFLNSGTLDIESGSVNFANSGTYAQTGATLEFGAAAPNLTGELNVPAEVNLDGTLTVHFLDGYTPLTGDLLELITYTSESGAFANLNLPALGAGQTWDLEYGGSVSLRVMAPVPGLTSNLQISGSVMTASSQPVAGVTVYATMNGSNLIQNGSFEEPNIGTTAYTFYPLGSTSIPGWTVVGGAGDNVGITSLYWEGPAEDGNQYFDPTGNTGSGGISQTFPTVQGTTYNLIFYHGTYSHHGIAACLGITIGTNYSTVGETSPGSGNLDWRQVIIPFTATSNLTTLTFSELTGFDANDNFVDNVQVVQPGVGNVVQGTTDATGHYQINVPNAAFQVGVGGLLAAGYNPVSDQMVTMNNANQTVNFTVVPLSVSEQFTITTAVNPPGSGTVSPGGTYNEGATVTLTAAPITISLPYSFSSWTENGVFQSSNPAYSFTADRNRNLVANFVLPVYVIIATNNPSSAGTVVGAGSFTYGTTNILTAQPGFGYTFSNWTEGGSIVGTGSVLTTVVFANHTFTANYAAANVMHVVTTATSPPGLAVIPGAGTYANGQTANFTAPALVTLGPDNYTFKQFTLSNTVVSTSNAFSKTFSTLDATNLEYVAVYTASSILPLLTNVTANYAGLVPATTDFILHLQFNHSMATNVSPVVLLTNSAASVQPAVGANGVWTSTVIADDTYSTPPITIAPGMDGTMQLLVSGAKDTNGNVLALTNAARFTVEATPPSNPVLSIVASNSSSITVGWSGYSAPADLAGFRVYIQGASFTSTAALPVLTGLGPTATSYQFTGLSLDTPYYVVVQAVDMAGNSSATVTPLEIILPSSLPPPVNITVSAVGASSANVSWPSYSTASLLGFGGFLLYYQTANFTSVTGLTAQATLGPGATSFQVNGLDRTKTYYFAVVGFNANNNFDSSVVTETWSDPYAGIIGADITIGGASPGVVNIYKSIMVASNATLTIQPGTTLLFAQGAGLTVEQGALIANGTALAPVILDSANDILGGTPAPADWAGVTLESGAGGSSLQFVEILYGAGLTIVSCAPVVDALTASFNLPDGLALKGDASLTTSSALINGNQVGVQQSATSLLTIQGSVIQNNATNAWASGTVPMDAPSNWWGTANGSALTPLLTGSVNYTPFLAYEPLLTPAIGASNGVTQVGTASVNLQLACRTATSMRLSEDLAFSGVFFSPFSNAVTFPLSAGGGLKHIFAQFRSVTGETNSPLELDVNYITAGPVIQYFSLSDGQTLNRPLTVTGSATATLGMQDLEFYVDGVGLATNAAGNFTYFFDIRSLSDAVHQVELLARDTAGNVATLEEDVIVALTPPLAPVLATPANNYVTNNSKLTIQGAAEENINIQVTDNGQVLGTTTTGASGKFTVANATLVEGVNSIVASASDNIGSTASAIRQVTVETIPPAAVVMNPPVYTPGSGMQLTWQFAATGKQATTFQLFWGTAAFTTTNQATGHSVQLAGMSDLVQGLATGTYYFGVVGFDAAGNPSPLSGLVSALYDATPPALSIAYGAPSPVGVEQLMVTLTSSKAVAGVPTLTIQPNGAPSPVALTLTNVALNTWQSALDITASTPSGTANVQGTAQDQLGNVFNGSPAGPQLVIDTTPPTATIVTAPPGPIQTINSTNIPVSMTLSKPPGPSITPTLSFSPPQGVGAPLILAGSGTNWTATLALSSSMGSGFGHFAFRSTDSVGNVGSNIVSGGQLELYNTALPSPPDAPTGLTAKSLPGGYVQLSWNAVSNAQIYRLYREAGTNFVIPAILDLDDITNTTVTDLPPVDGDYSYGISASRLGSESAISNTVVGLSDRTPPDAPTNVMVQLAATGVQITWEEPTGGETPDHYNIYRNGTLIQTVPAITPVTDYPPRGTDTYIVSASDAVGNESSSAPAQIVLLVGPPASVSVVAAQGQAKVISWVPGDTSTVGYNLYRNGVLQNSSPLTVLTYTDSLTSADVVTYGVSAVNASGQQSPQRMVTVYPVAFGLLVNAQGGKVSQAVFTGYFDQFTASISNLSATASLQVSQLILDRMSTGSSPLEVTQTLGAAISPGASAQQSIIVPEAAVAATQTIQLTALQQTDNEGNSVTYQQTFSVTDVSVPPTEIVVSVNQLPLAGGLSPIQVQVFNRAFVDMQLVVERSFGSKPGDVYISVQNALGQEVSRTPFEGAPAGTIFLSDGTGYVDIAAGSSIKLTVPNVLTPAALAGTTNSAFVAVAQTIYNQIGTPSQTQSGPLSGSMVSSLSLPPYYGTSQTDKSVYDNDDPVTISGQALSQSTGLPVPNAALNIGFATRGYVWFQSVMTDASGNYQYTYNPTPGLGGTLNIWAANPLVVDQLNQVQITIERVYDNPAGADVTMSKNGTLDFSITLVNPGDVPLTAFATSFAAYAVSGTNLTPTTLITGTNLTGSSFSIAPNQTLTLNLKLAAAINAPGTAESVFTFTSAEGASVTFTGSMDLLPAVPVLSVTQPAVSYLEVNVNRGDQISGQVTIANLGLDTLKGVTMTPPTNSWIGLNLPGLSNGVYVLPDIPPGQSNTYTVVFSPPSTLPLAQYSDGIIIQGANLAIPFKAGVYAIVTSDLTGSAQFYVDDILGDALTGASVRLNNSLISSTVGPFYTDTNGLVTVSNLEEGTWTWQASAPGCSASDGVVTIVADQTVYQHARLNRSLVTVNFSVVPVPFSDNYTITITENYQTYVPVPVLVVTPPLQQFTNVMPGFQATYTVTVQNQGLVQMTDLTIAGDQDNQSSYQPLITYVPVVLPQQTIDVPFTVNYWGSNAPSHQELGPALAGCVPGADAAQFAGIIGGFIDGLNAICNADGLCPVDKTVLKILGAAAVSLAIYNYLGGILDAIALAPEALASYIGCVIGTLLAGGLGGGGGGGGGGPPQESNQGFQGTGNGCLAAETRVLMADGSLKMISEIQTNDMVRSGERTDNIAVVSEVCVLETDHFDELRLRRLRGQAVPSVRTTAEHLFWVDGKGWTAARALKPGDWLSNSEGAPIEIVENRVLEKSMKVYTLQLARDNAFYANDVLVHDLCGALPATVVSSTTEVSK